MAKLFNGLVAAKGKPDSLLTERKSSGRISVSAQFTVESDQRGSDERGRSIEVGGSTVTAFLTVTDKTRKRIIESLTYCGMSEQAAQRVIETAEEGMCGKIPSRFGFGTQVCELDCEISTFDGKTNTKVNWINPIGGGGRRGKDAPEVDLGISEAKPRNSANNNGNGSGAAQKAPWETA